METVDLGRNKLVGTDMQAIIKAASTKFSPIGNEKPYGDGYAANKIINKIAQS